MMAFDRTAAREATKAMPWIPVYRLSSEQTKTKMPVNLSALIRDTVEDGLDGLDLSRKWNWTPELIAEIRNAGLKIFVWTVNDPDEARLLARLGVDGITTDDPALIQQALGANP